MARCDASLVEWPVWWVHTVVVSHEPSEFPIMLGGTGSELLVEGLYNSLRAGVGFPLKAIEMFGGELDFLPPSLRSRDQ